MKAVLIHSYIAVVFLSAIPARGQVANATNPAAQTQPEKANDAEYLNYAIPPSATTKETIVKNSSEVAKRVNYYVNNELVGIRHFGPDEKILSESLFKNRKLHGVQREWYADGKVKSESPYRNGVMNGVFRKFKKDGTETGTYEMKDGSGVVLTWDDLGQKRSACDFVNSVREGIFRLWDDKGHLLEKSSYKAGHRDGWTLRYGDDEKLISAAGWKSGRLCGASILLDSTNKPLKGYPKFFIDGKVATQTQFDAACEKDPLLKDLVTPPANAVSATSAAKTP